MRKWIGSALLLAAVAFIPAQLVAQRRPAGRPAARAQPPQFAAELNWSSDADFGIGGRGVFGLQSLFPKVPLDGIVSFDYFFPSAPSGVSAHYWEINGNVAYRFRVPARSSLAPYGGGGTGRRAPLGRELCRDERHGCKEQGTADPLPHVGASPVGNSPRARRVKQMAAHR